MVPYAGILLVLVHFPDGFWGTYPRMQASLGNKILGPRHNFGGIPSFRKAHIKKQTLNRSIRLKTFGAAAQRPGCAMTRSDSYELSYPGDGSTIQRAPVR